jgi:SAM-dependent methyltransferase
MSKQYALDYNKSTTTSHASRNAEVDAAFLLPHLKPHYRIIDVGCGPGTITTGFCKYVPDGHVVGVDISAEVLSEAQDRARALPGGVPTNVVFHRVDILQGFGAPGAAVGENDQPCPIPTSWKQSFDVIFMSQFLPHLSDPVTVLANLKQLVKPGTGILASTSYDTSTMVFTPDPTGQLGKWGNTMGRLVVHGAGAPSMYGGRDMPAHHYAAGFGEDQLTLSARTLIYRTQEERRWWGQSNAQRWVEGSKYRKLAMSGCGMTEEDCEGMVRALRGWAAEEKGMYFAIAIEIIARVD